MSDRPDDREAAPTPADRLERIIDRQVALMQRQLELMRAAETASRAGSVGTPVLRPVLAGPDHEVRPTMSAVERSIPLTDAQRDVWVVCQLSPEGSAAYNLSTALSLRGPLDVPALQEALRRLVQRHEALRGTIDATGDRLLIHPDAPTELTLVDLAELPDAAREARVAAVLDAELADPYDLVAGPLCRFRLVRLGEEEHLLVLSAHHLVCDGWSFGVMHRDLAAFYSHLAGDGSGPVGSPDRLDAFVAFREEHAEASRRYWLDRYADPAAQLDLPVDHPRPPVRGFDYDAVRAVVDARLLADLRAAATARGVTLFALLLAAWQIVLHRLSGQEEFASGVFVSGQAAMGARDLVGLCANLLPLRVRIAPEDTIALLAERLQLELYDGFDHQHHPLGRLASALQLPRDPSRPLMLSTVITLETPSPGLDFAGLQVAESVHGRRRFGFFDAELYLTETLHDIKVDLQYSRGLFDRETIERWAQHYVHVLRQLIGRAATPVSAVQLLEDGERRELIGRWNDTQAPIPAASTHERFAAIAASHPDRIALRTADRQLTYRELDTRANQLARHLRDLGVGRDRTVGVNLDRSPEMVVALLAVLKAGGAYVPMDPMFPDERLAMIAADAGLHALVTQAALAGTIDVGDIPVVVLERDAELLAAQGGSDPGVPVDPDDLAYVIYTSGSTGRPKGVEIPHRALTNLLESMRREPGLVEDDALLAVTTMSFDIAGLELFLPLITGATLVLADQLQAVDAVWLRDRLAVGDISVMQATPATWQMLLDAGWTGTPGLKVLCGGEALSPELAAALVGRVGSLWNMYGPTETTIWSSVCRIESGAAPIPLGHPIANTELHVLDAQLRLQPIGVAGELWIGGAGLARGYHGREDLTRDRFAAIRFDDGLERRLYRTGDVVRRRGDGSIEYLGRSDFQVKVRGFRIELGEIETALARHPDVKECVVTARGPDQASRRLVAYIIPAGAEAGNVTALRGHLRQTLPEYMIPAVFVFLDAFPLTANKKVDRARMPEPVGERPDLESNLVAPRTDVEVALARIWQNLLSVDRVGVEDNFFDLGGDSLLALRSIMAANRAGLSLSPMSIFRHQTIAELALQAEQASESLAGEQGIVTGPLPLTPAQLRFLTERRTPDPHHWNLASLVEVDRLSPGALRDALASMLRHHDTLRLRLWEDATGWHQEVAPVGQEIAVESHDLSGMSAEERAAAIEAACARLQASFDLAQPPLIRVAYFDCGPGERDRLFITIHHFAVDGLTWSVFWEDLEEAYRQALDGHAVTLPPKTTSFRTWAIQLEQLASSPRAANAADRWLSLPWTRVRALPRDLGGGPVLNVNASAAAVRLELSAQETGRLLGSRHRPEHLIIAAIGRCLAGWTASDTILMDVLSHGRDAAVEGVNLARTVGFTLSYNPLVLRNPSWDAAPQVLDQVAGQIEALPEGFSFELLRFHSPEPELRNRLTALPRAEVLFNYAGTQDAVQLDSQFRPAAESSGPSESPQGLRQYPIAIRATLVPHLRLTFVYSTNVHTEATVRSRADAVGAAIRELLGLAPVTR